MSSRIAEFTSADDALLFAKMKNRMCGSDDYDVCGGVHMLYAVMPKIRYEADFSPFEPHQLRAMNQDYDIEDHDDER